MDENRDTVDKNPTVLQFIEKRVLTLKKTPLLVSVCNRKPYHTNILVIVFFVKKREPCKAHSLGYFAANPYILKRVPFLYFLQKARNIENIHFSVFTINKTVNGPYFGTVRFAIKIENGKRFCFVMLRFALFYPKMGNAFVISTVRFAVKKKYWKTVFIL